MAERPSARLDSWKEIAAYLGRDVTTVIRWAKERGLPAHRVPGGQRHTVFAYREEIDDWLRGEGSSPNGVSVQAPAPKTTSGQRAGSWLWKWGVVGFALVVALALAASRRLNREATRLVSVSIHDHKLTALDEAGVSAWTYSFSWPVENRNAGGAVRQSVIADVDGDGRDEVLVAVTPVERVPEQREQDELYCFSRSGELKWRFRFEDALRFRASEYGAPWGFGDLHVFDSAGGKRIAYSVLHNSWWPSALVILDGRGREVGRYVSAGHIFRTNAIEDSGRRLLLAGGISNANNSAMLAVLDADNVSGTSPESPGSSFECLNCPGGKPLRYFVFPRSEVNRVSGELFNGANQINVYSGQAQVRVYEQSWLDPAQSIYEFSANMDLRRATYSDAYWDRHRKLELEGKILHAREQCPERDGPRAIRVWEPQAGWREIHPAALTATAR